MTQSIKRARRQLKEAEREVSKSTRKPAPKWRMILAKLGIRKPIARWVVRQEMRYATALKVAMKRASHKLARG